jgi:hypothetical protein
LTSGRTTLLRSRGRACYPARPHRHRGRAQPLLYANGDPVNFSDPFGVCATDEHGNEDPECLALVKMGTDTRSLVARLAGAAVTILACACSASPYVQSSSSELPGEWQWLWAFGGPREDTTTFGGDSAVLRLQPAGTYRLEARSRAPAEGTYRIGETGVATSNGENGPTVHFSPAPQFLHASEFVVFLRGDALTLRTLAHDEFDYTFVRRPQLISASA